MGEWVAASESQSDKPDTRDGSSWMTSLGSDWWATLLGLLIAVLAVVNLLPKIPW